MYATLRDIFRLNPIQNAAKVPLRLFTKRPNINFSADSNQHERISAAILFLSAGCLRNGNLITSGRFNYLKQSCNSSYFHGLRKRNGRNQRITRVRLRLRTIVKTEWMSGRERTLLQFAGVKKQQRRNKEAARHGWEIRGKRGQRIEAVGKKGSAVFPRRPLVNYVFVEPIESHCSALRKGYKRNVEAAIKAGRKASFYFAKSDEWPAGFRRFFVPPFLSNQHRCLCALSLAFLSVFFLHLWRARARQAAAILSFTFRVSALRPSTRCYFIYLVHSCLLCCSGEQSTPAKTEITTRVLPRYTGRFIDEFIARPSFAVTWKVVMNSKRNIQAAKLPR